MSYYVRISCFTFSDCWFPVSQFGLKTKFKAKTKKL
nr:MAG TPA: hypothetical protein [Caudoviricetes sp.]